MRTDIRSFHRTFRQDEDKESKRFIWVIPSLLFLRSGGGFGGLFVVLLGFCSSGHYITSVYVSE